jgi:synaptic vesicle membrane protein VAT-1
MNQIFIVGHGGPEKLQLRESPDPSPAGAEIRIRVKASGVNFADILVRDIARHVGAIIYGTASSSKHAFLMQRGLHEAIDYRTKDWLVELKRLTGGKGVALILDPLGGKHWKKSYTALRATGRLGMFGVSVATTSKLPGPLRLLQIGLGTPLFHPLALMSANKSVFGVNLGHLWHEPEMIAAWKDALIKGVADVAVRNLS